MAWTLHPCWFNRVPSVLHCAPAHCTGSVTTVVTTLHCTFTHLCVIFNTFGRSTYIMWWPARCCNDTGNGTCAGRGSGWRAARTSYNININAVLLLCSQFPVNCVRCVASGRAAVAYTSCPGPGRVGFCSTVAQHLFIITLVSLTFAD